MSCAASRAWYSESNAMPSFNSSTPSFFFLTPASKAGSKSFASFTLEPGFTRNGSMKRAIRFSMSAIQISSRSSPRGNLRRTGGRARPARP